jgi:hypothetical protein
MPVAYASGSPRDDCAPALRLPGLLALPAPAQSLLPLALPGLPLLPLPLLAPPVTGLDLPTLDLPRAPVPTL